MLRVGAPAVEVRDTLAAGDVFHAALVVELAAQAQGYPHGNEEEGLEVEAAAARFACTAAALKCSRFGGRLGAPTRTEVAEYMAAEAKEELESETVEYRLKGGSDTLRSGVHFGRIEENTPI